MSNNNKVFPRSASRLIAVQILFSKYFNEDATTPLIIDHCLASKMWKLDIEDVDIKSFDKNFLLEIIRGVEENYDYLTKVLEQFLVKISLKDISTLTITILKCAIWELLFNSKNVNKDIVISQYVALVSCFYVNNEVSLTNKLLSIIATEML